MTTVPAATVGNAIKREIEASLAIAAYRDVAPATEVPPFITINDGIVTTPDDRVDGGRANNVATTTVQIDVWEAWRDVAGNNAESPTLADDVTRLLHGSRLEAAPMRVYGVTVVSRRRLLDTEAKGATHRGLVHTAITATVNRLL